MADFLGADGDHFIGWTMLDIARALPRHANDSLVAVDRYEAQLRREHPELY